MHDSTAPDSADLGTEQVSYRVRRAAELLSISERKCWQLVDQGDIESVKIGRARLIPRAALLAYVERLRSAA
jgi:excisionase family DNA binding protein